MPVVSPETAVIADAVMLACRAPSLHNSQPWQWIGEGEALHLFADPRRAVRATDRSGRELLLSCGAVLDHLRVALAAVGWEAFTSRFPGQDHPDHLASLRFSPLEAISEGHRRRADAIPRRRTDRLPFQPPAAWADLESLLRRTVAAHGASLDVVADDARPALAEASRLTETLRRYDTLYQTELRWWTSPFAPEPRVPGSALLSTSEGGRVDVARAFPPAGGRHRRETVAQDRSKILVLCTHEDARLDVLRCGEALSAVLLECTAAGMATCTLSHMTELAQSRDIIRQLVGQAGQPQLLIRVGRSPEDDDQIEPTGRRPLAEVLEFRG